MVLIKVSGGENGWWGKIFRGAPSPGPDFLKIEQEPCLEPAEAGRPGPRWGSLDRPHLPLRLPGATGAEDVPFC